ncbi:hypothetical protein [Ligilactobacillus agilis]|uniref:hypothetical protein n=1 Tax=Ligilactobacillus agilis TaxID=1601 RepID=UPI00067F0C3C|nr:hypothetical protein [Ligilactobacillus agilis]
MQVDAIGNQIQIDNLTDVLENISYQLTKNVEVLEADGQWLKADSLKENQYLKQNRHSVSLTTNPNLNLAELKSELSLLTETLSKQLTRGQKVFPFSQASKKHHGRQPGYSLKVVLPENLFKLLYTSKFKETKIDYLSFRNQVYLKLAQQLVAKRAYMTYLFGATPFAWQEGVSEELSSPKRSVTNSLNQVELKEANALDYLNLESYLASKSSASLTSDNVNLNLIEIDGKQTIEALQITGLDFNPGSETLIEEPALEFLNVCLGYFLMTEGIGAGDLKASLSQARALNQTVASENPFAPSVVAGELRKFLEELNHFASAYYYPGWQSAYAKLRKRLADPKASLSASLLRAQGEADSLYSLALSGGFKTETSKQRLSYELQTMLTAAIMANHKFRILNQELGLVQIDETILQAGLKTKENSALLETMWANKQVSKQLVSAGGFETLKAWQVKSLQELETLAPKLADKALAIKSVSDQAAKASRLFRLPPSSKQLKASVQAVLKEQKQALLEQVAPGSTYRALIIKGKLVSLVERIPANVVGNGRASLKELIAGKHLTLGSVERETLASQGIGLNDVIARGIQVLLRYDATENTGASQVESLADLDESYRTAIEKIAQILGMSEGQIDLIIPNIYQAYQQEPGQLYFLGAHRQINLALHLQVLMAANEDLPATILDELLKAN